MNEFIKYDWSNLIGINFASSSLTDDSFKKFVDNYHLYPQIKILYLCKLFNKVSLQ